MHSILCALVCVAIIGDTRRVQTSLGEWGVRDWESKNMVRNLKGEITDTELGMMNLMNAMQDPSLQKGMAEGLRQPEGRAELLKMLANPRFQAQAKRISDDLQPCLAALRASIVSRAPPPMMGGLTGLPRIPSKALALTKKFNPGGVYREPIATLWRDLETLYGLEGTVTGGSTGGSRRDPTRIGKGASTGKFRGLSYTVDLRAETVYAVVKKDPTLLNPAVTNRFVATESKRILVELLGSEKEAINVMKADPSVLREGEALWEKSAGQIKTRALAKSMGPAVMGVGAIAAAVIANEQLGLGLTLDAALPALGL